MTKTYSDKIEAGTKYEVRKMTYDAARPYAVVAAFRNFNRVIARYSDEQQANRRCRDMNTSPR